MRLWVTRAEPGASATARALHGRGHAALVAPLLTVEPIAQAAPDLDGVAALAFTSANAVRAFATLSPRRDRPAWVVGEATARAARAAGLEVAGIGGSDARALAETIALDPAGAGVVLHPAAETPAADLVALLAARGIAARAVAVHRTRAADRLPAAAEAALRAGDLEGVLLHSPRAAQVLASLLLDGPTALAELAAGLWTFGLSPACLAPLPPESFPHRSAATLPNEAALLDRLPPP